MVYNWLIFIQKKLTIFLVEKIASCYNYEKVTLTIHINQHQLPLWLRDD